MRNRNEYPSLGLEEIVPKKVKPEKEETLEIPKKNFLGLEDSVNSILDETSYKKGDKLTEGFCARVILDYCKKKGIAMDKEFEKITYNQLFSEIIQIFEDPLFRQNLKSEIGLTLKKGVKENFEKRMRNINKNASAEEKPKVDQDFGWTKGHYDN